MNRRQILHTGSLGALGFIAARNIPTALGQTRSIGANERIRVGIIGFSDRFKSSLLPSFLAYAEEFNCEIGGVSDLWSRRRDEAAEWFKKHSFIVALLEGSMDSRPVLISDHYDELRRVERGYGRGKKPDDYLAEFQKYVRENMNRLPALVVVAQRPKDLTRAELKELALALDNAGFTERNLQTAWREKTNEDIAASIIGFIRQAAIGDPLVAYERRVDAALDRLLATQSWTQPRRKWLERIGKQLKAEKVVDRTSLDEGQFATSGGFDRLNKVFEGRLEEILGRLGESVWGEVG